MWRRDLNSRKLGHNSDSSCVDDNNGLDGRGLVAELQRTSLKRLGMVA
jgi:hypothetical protein